MSDSLELEQIENWPDLYWSYNLPLQMWRTDSEIRAEWAVVNYMPRRCSVVSLDEKVSKGDLPAFCRNTSKILRNLASLFDLLGEGKIDHVYYPDSSLTEAAAHHDKHGVNGSAAAQS